MLTAGFNWRLPFADVIQRSFSNRLQNIALSLRGDSGGRLPLQLEVSLEVVGTTDPKVVAVLAYQVDNPEAHLKAVAEDAVRELMIDWSYEQVLHDEELAGKIKERLADVSARLGFEIRQVRITSIRPDQSVQDAILAGERAAVVQKNERAQGEHDATMLKAQAEASATAAEIEAGASRAQMAEMSRQLPDIIAELRREGIDRGQASSLVTVMLYRELVLAVAPNAQARITLLPPTVDLAATTALNTVSQDGTSAAAAA